MKVKLFKFCENPDLIKLENNLKELMPMGVGCPGGKFMSQKNTLR